MARKQVNIESLAESIHESRQWIWRKRNPKMPFPPFIELIENDKDELVGQAEYILSKYNVYRR